MKIENYLCDTDFEKFNENSMMKHTCIKQLEIIGEASNHVTTETKNKFPSIEWNQIVGMRNVFVHEYFGIDAALVWQIIDNDLPLLKEQISEIVGNIE